MQGCNSGRKSTVLTKRSSRNALTGTDLPLAVSCRAAFRFGITTVAINRDYRFRHSDSYLYSGAALS